MIWRMQMYCRSKNRKCRANEKIRLRSEHPRKNLVALLLPRPVLHPSHDLLDPFAGLDQTRFSEVNVVD